MTERLILHEYAASGNCYKIRLTAALVGVPLERREYDILKGETRTGEFLTTVNSNGRIPVLQIGDRFLPESNAACCYLADGSALMPEDRFERADMLRWMFFEQYNHEPNIATLRFWFGSVGEANFSEFQRAALPVKRAGGEAALEVMDRHLAGNDWFAGSAVSVADVVLYAYTHLAEGGGFDLTGHNHVRGWLERLENLPNYVTLA